MRVVADREVCIGAGMCALTAPDVFDQDDDGRVALRTSRVGDDNLDAVREAVRLCPSGALVVRLAEE